MNNAIKFEDIKNQWMKDPAFRKAYDDLEQSTQEQPEKSDALKKVTPTLKRKSNQADLITY